MKKTPPTKPAEKPVVERTFFNISKFDPNLRNRMVGEARLRGFHSVSDFMEVVSRDYLAKNPLETK